MNRLSVSGPGFMWELLVAGCHFIPHESVARVGPGFMRELVVAGCHFVPHESAAGERQPHPVMSLASVGVPWLLAICGLLGLDRGRTKRTVRSCCDGIECQ